MSMTLKVAVRNIFRQKKRTFLLAGAIAFGMLVITVMNSFTGGLVENIRHNIGDIFGGHVFIMGQEYPEGGKIISRIKPDERLDQLLEENSHLISGHTKRSDVTANLIFGSKQTVDSLYGVDFIEEDKLLESLALSRGSFDNMLEQPNGIIITETVGKRLGVEPGETILVKLDTVTGQQNVGEFQVEAFIVDQDMFGISASYAHRTYLNELLDLEPHEFQNFYLTIYDLNEAEGIARDFRVGLRNPDEEDKEEPEGEAVVTVGGVPVTPDQKKEPIQPWEGTRYNVISINDIMEPIEQIVGVFDSIGLAVFLILLFVTMIGIMNTFRMIMIERTKEIGTMRAFGMHKKQVKRIFLWEATLVGLLGVVTGLVLSGILVLILGNLNLNLDPSLQLFLKDGKLTFVLSQTAILVNVFLVVMISLVAAYWPAKAAAKLSPMEALSSRI